jgi:hypothetical protein
MDGSPQCGLLQRSLGHFDAAEWAPSTASLADIGEPIRDDRFQKRTFVGALSMSLSATSRHPKGRTFLDRQRCVDIVDNRRETALGHVGGGI